MRTWKVQWRGEANTSWNDLPYEEWDREEHAEMRVKGYWETLGMPIEFRVVEVLPHESQQPLPAVQ